MFEYKVDIYKVKYAEDAMNTYAREGWRVIAVAPDHITGFVDVFFEREVTSEQAAEDTSQHENAAPETTVEHIDPSTYPEDPDAFNSDIWDFVPPDEKTESEETV